MTTTETSAALPFLLPAANLVIGDTIRMDGVTGMIRAISRYVPCVLTFSFVGTSQSVTCKPDALVERIHNAPVEVLNDVVTALTTAVDKWQGRADELGGRENRVARLRGEVYETCVKDVRAILARLQSAQPDNDASGQPECGEYGPNDGVCGQPVIDGVCPDHGEVGPPVES
jgi:hypothetical protein